MLPALQRRNRDERLDGAVAGAGALAGQRRVYPGDALLDGHHGVCHREREVLVRVDAQLGGRVEDVAVGAHPLADAIHGQPAAGVGDVDAVGAVGLHQQGLLRELLGRGEVAHHQEPGDVHPQVAGGRDVLGGDVRLRAVRCDADRTNAQAVGVLELLDGPDPREQQRGEPCPGQVGGRRLDPLPVGVGAGAVVQAAAGEAVAVGHLDGIDAGRIEGSDDPPHVLGRDAVPDRMHAVAQGDVLDEEPGG